MSQRHLVTPGETLLGIAKRYGYSWRTLWQHADNAALRDKRRSPNVLLAGDVVFVPDRQPKEAACATGQRHRFVRRGEPAQLRLQLRSLGQPRKHEPYELLVTLSHGEHRVSGQTDGEGVLCHRMPSDTRRARLLLCRGSEILELAIGYLDPVDDLGGAQQRLRNLGFPIADEDGVLGADTAAALQAFQARQGLTQSAALDADTVQALRRVYP